MRLSVRTFVLACALGVAGTPVYAQTCRGFPSMAAGSFNVSGGGYAGGRFWGSEADINFGRRGGGPFVNVGVSTVTYLDAPKESRFSYGAAVGYEVSRRDGLIVCPFITGSMERGQEIEYEPGLQLRTTGHVTSIGLAVAGEQGRGRFSTAPFLSARFAQIHVEVAGDSTSNQTQNGGLGSAGLGVRMSDAIQMTPYFTFGTFARQDLVFHLRFSVALQFKR